MSKSTGFAFGASAGNQRVWRAAAYARLSSEDGDVGGSASITSQLQIIQEFVSSRDDITLVKKFQDDGWSGSNFDRPGFKAMMAAVDAGRVDCILVKDLSRLGRNYLECGRYIERIFPSKGVRLVAVNDNYDGLKALGPISADAFAPSDEALIVPFKNLMNDHYCAQVSAKTKAALAVRRRAGLFVGSFAPYGFCKDPANRNALIKDPVAAPVVARIFTMRAEGMSLGGIARTLNDEGVASPAALKRMRGDRLASGCAKPTGDAPRWCATQVARILGNRMYTGCLVQGRTFSPSFRQRSRYELPPELWDCVEEACPAIVDVELYELVQELGRGALSVRGGCSCGVGGASGANGSGNVLRGLAYCGWCEGRLKLQMIRRPGKEYAYLRCASGCGFSVRAEPVFSAVGEAAGCCDRAGILASVRRVEVRDGDSICVILRDGKSVNVTWA